MASWAFVTVLTSDSYLPGALVTAGSIKSTEKASTRKYDLVCLVTLDSVSVQSIKALRQMYDLVISAEEIRSGHSEPELNLLGRQDLSSTITKIHIWRLTQYEKVIYLDSDTLMLKPISHLFELASPFSACADIGWPDCFNTGLMVIRPSSETFEKIFQHFLSYGSWDGGDQGLLNDYFSRPSEELSPKEPGDQSQGWNRLSFIYNVTPSAYYTYAPAYKRYGDKISMIHFIGSEKPWHLINRRRYRNAYAPNQQSESLNAVNYDSLVDHWLDVYEDVVGPVEPLEWASLQPEFNVPKYLSEWDSTKPSSYQPPTLDALKEIFSRKQAAIGSQSYNMKASNNEGGYMSLPFLDLACKARDYILIEQGKTINTTDSTQELQSVPPESNHLQHRQDNPDHSHQVWDPSRSSPPIRGGYQMNQPITKHYEAVWDKPFSEQSRSFFQPPAITHSIPQITHQDYSQFSKAPQPNAVQAVFPWEENAHHHTGRVFPSEASRTSTSLSSRHEDSNRSVANANRDNQTSLCQIYRNAWDDDPMIGRWAKARSISGSNRNSSSGGTKSKETKAALIQTPRLEIRSFDFDRCGKEGQNVSREAQDVGRIPTYNSHQQHPSRQITLSSSSYRPRRDSEGSSQDADEEDVGEDEDQSSDIRTFAEETSSESTITTPPEKPKSDQISAKLDATKNPEINKTGTFDSTSRLPTNRSMIIGVPVQMLRTSSSSSNSSVHSWETDNKNNLARRATSLMG